MNAPVVASDARCPPAFWKEGKADRVFALSVAALLVLTTLAKLRAASSSAAVLGLPDPVLGLNHRLVLIGASSLELAIAGYLICGRHGLAKCLLVLWLVSNFILYRIALWWIEADGSCPCLGNLGDTWPVERRLVDRALKLMLAYLLVGSLFFLLRAPVTNAFGRLTERGRRRLRWALALGCALALIPALQVGCVAVVNPPTTGPMLLRWAKGKLTGVSQPPNHHQWRNLDAVPAVFLKSVIVGEDDQFFEHQGFNWKQIRYAIGEAWRTGRPPRGASTITQQCARSLFLWQGRSWIRKGLEAYYTLWMEWLLSKRRILELYVNLIELGDGIYGIEAGARHHYGKAARDLTTEEAAMLAAILPAPKRWNPKQPTERARRWQQHILNALQQVPLSPPADSTTP